MKHRSTVSMISLLAVCAILALAYNYVLSFRNDPLHLFRALNAKLYPPNWADFVSVGASHLERYYHTFFVIHSTAAAIWTALAFFQIFTAVTRTRLLVPDLHRRLGDLTLASVSICLVSGAFMLPAGRVTDYHYTAAFLVATYVYTGLGLFQMIASRRRTGTRSCRTRHIKGAMRLTAPPLASLLQHIVYLLFLSLSLSSLVAWRLSLLAAGVPAAAICEYAAVRRTRGSLRSGRTGGAAGPSHRNLDLEAR